MKIIKVLFITIGLTLSFSASADRTEQVQHLFSWAESNFPTLFQPAGASIQTASTWQFVYYPSTNIYIGVNDQNEVYVLGNPFGGLTYIDTLTNLLVASGYVDFDISDGDNSGSTGQFDLRDFVAPTTSQTHYMNRYASDGSYVWFEDDFSIFYEMLSDTQVKITYTEDSNDNQILEFTNNQIRTSVEPQIGSLVGAYELSGARNVDIGDTISSFDINSNTPNGTYNANVTCYLKAHHSSKSFVLEGQTYTYQDVLETECTSVGTSVMSYFGTSTTSNFYDVSSEFLARGIGSVASYDEDCYDVSMMEIKDNLSSCASKQYSWEVKTY